MKGEVMQKVVIPEVSAYDILNFLDFDRVDIKSVHNGFIFDVSGSMRYKLEKLLNTGFERQQILVSNKSKDITIVLKVENFKGNNLEYWNMRIFQRNSRGKVFELGFSINHMRKFYSIFQVKVLEMSLEQGFSSYGNLLSRLEEKIHSDFLSLTKKDLEVLWQRFELTSFEIKQILFSYKRDILSNYEFYAEMIDDGEQYKAAIKRNEELWPLKNLYEKVAKRHNIDLEKGKVEDS